MAKFNALNKVAELINKLFGATIEISEDNDDVTMYDSIKSSLEDYSERMLEMFEGLEEKAKASDALQLQVTELTRDVDAHKLTINEQNTKIAEMQTSFDKKLSDFRAEVHAELVKENPTLNFNGLKVLNEPDVNNRTKEMIVDAWKEDNKPKISVG